MNPPQRPPRPVKPATPHRPASTPLQDADIMELDGLLAEVPAPLQALDLSALDGFLLGVLLQPQRPAPARWLPFITDEQGRPLPGAWPAGGRLQALVLQRYAELDALIEARQWFDPWLTDVDEESWPQEAVQPWVLGFATACSEFPALTEGPGREAPELIEALAQLYQHLDPADLEDAEALLAEIDTLEPPASMEEAVESLVRGCLLLADVSRPLRRSGAAHPPRRAEQGPRRSAGQASGPGGLGGTRPRGPDDSRPHGRGDTRPSGPDGNRPRGPEDTPPNGSGGTRPRKAGGHGRR